MRQKHSVHTIAAGIIMLIMAITLGGCTSNDGDIGPLFGSWRLESMTLEGADEQPPLPRMVWSFQNSVVCFQTIGLNHFVQENWASWRRTDSGMVIDFSNSDNDTPEGEWPYNPPSGLGFPWPPDKVVMTVDRLDSHNLDLTYINPKDGNTYKYKLKKLY